MISLIVKIFIALAGLAAAAFFLVIGFANRSQSYVKTGWIVGLITVVIIGAIILMEYLLGI